MEEQDKDNKPEVSELNDNSEVHIVKTVSDGSACEHNFQDDYIDGDKQHQQCLNCWQGRWRGRND